MITNFKGYCNTCAIAGLKAPQVCALSGLKIEAKDYCSKHRTSLTKCSICGNVILADAVIDNGHLICQSCFSILKTCKTCHFGNVCEFQTNPSPIPQMINKQIRQGNMVAVTQVMNPERIHITCEKGCKCFDKENGCLKQNGMCGNQEVKYFD